MSGHSKWATIHRKKGLLDAARGKVFKKLAKELFLYILDENKESIDFDNLKVFKSIDDFDTKLNLW